MEGERERWTRKEEREREEEGVQDKREVYEILT